MSRDERMVAEWLSKNEITICGDSDSGVIRNFKHGYSSAIMEYAVTGNLSGDMAAHEHDGVSYSSRPESDKTKKGMIECIEL